MSSERTITKKELAARANDFVEWLRDSDMLPDDAVTECEFNPHSSKDLAALWIFMEAASACSGAYHRVSEVAADEPRGLVDPESPVVEMLHAVVYAAEIKAARKAREYVLPLLGEDAASEIEDILLNCSVHQCALAKDS